MANEADVAEYPLASSNAAADPLTILNAPKEHEITLYIKGLADSVTEEQLRALFDMVGGVKSVEICVDEVTGESLGYGYVHYTVPENAAKAVELLNFSLLNGRKIRIFYSNSGGTLGILFFKNLHEGYDKKAVEHLFSRYGKVISCVLELDAFRMPKGCGYVRFENADNASYAAQELNGMELDGKKICVDDDLLKLKFTNVCAKNISGWMTENNLIEVFGHIGKVKGAVVVRDEYGVSKGIGFVKFEDWEDASTSIEKLNGRRIYGREWSVERAHSRFEKLSDNMRTLFVKYLSNEINYVDELKKLFSPFGTITSCKILRDSNGRSRGIGFIVFSTFNEAIGAICEMHGKEMHGKSLFVTFARYKGPSPQCGPVTAASCVA